MGSPADSASFDQIKQRLDLRAVLTDLGVEVDGRTYPHRARCFVHKDGNNPNLRVYDDHYHCYSCGAHGDVIDAIERLQGLDTGRALQVAAEMAGVTLPERSKTAEKQRAKEVNRSALLGAVADYCKEQLWSGPGEEALDYLMESRGLSPGVLEEQRIGWWPDYESIRRNVVNGQFRREHLRKLGLLVKNDNGEYEILGRCIVFPFMHAGRVVYMTGRKLQVKEGRGKSRKPRATEGGLAGNVIYGQAALRRPDSFLVEGEIDRLTYLQAGFECAAVTGNTSFPVGFARMCGSNRIYSAMDLDKGGQEAEARVYGARWSKRQDPPRFTEGLADQALFCRPDWPNIRHGADVTQAQDANDALQGYYQNLGDWQKATEAFAEEVKRARDEARPYASVLLQDAPTTPEGAAEWVQRRVVPILARMEEVLAIPLVKEAGKIVKDLPTIKRALTAERKRQDQEEQRSNLTLLPGGKDDPEGEDEPVVLENGVIVPEGWAVSEGRLYTRQKRENKNRGVYYHDELIADRAPFLTRRFEEGSTQREAFEITFCTPHGTKKKIKSPRGEVMTRAGSLSLAEYGYPAHEGNARQLPVWMSAQETSNAHRLPVVASARSMGWQGPDVFLVGHRTIGADSPVFVPADVGDDQTAMALKPDGSLDAWKEGLLYPVFDSYPTMMFALVAAHAPAVLKAAGISGGFVVEFASADSSIGKSHALYVAESVWGCPGKPGFHQSANASFTAPERLFAIMGDGLPTFRDEGKLQKPERYVELIYTAANGVGRDRGSLKGRQETTEWTTVLFVTSEKSVQSLSPDGGITGRTLTIDYSPMDAVTDRTKRDIEAFRAVTHVNHGHSGPAFVQHLINEGGEVWQAKVRKTHQSWLRQLGDMFGGSGIMRRKTEHLAATLTTAELLQPVWGIDCTEQLLRLFEWWADEMPERDLPLEALKKTIAWMTYNWGRLMDHAEHFDEAPTSDRIRDMIGVSKYVHKQVGSHVGIFKVPLVKFLEDQGYGSDMLSHWSRRGWIIRNGKEKTVPIRLFGGHRRVVLFPPDAFEEGA